MAAARSDDEDGITSINITPLVDVFLVLLILVMISSSITKMSSLGPASPRSRLQSAPHAMPAATTAVIASGL